MSIGEKIKELRKSEKLNQEEFGKKVGISKNAVWNYENGKREPSLEILTKISNAFDMSLLEILVDEHGQVDEKDFNTLNTSEIDKRLIYLEPSKIEAIDVDFFITSKIDDILRNTEVQKKFNFSYDLFNEDNYSEFINFIIDMIEFKLNQLKKNKN